METQNKVTDSITGIYEIPNRFTSYLLIDDSEALFGYYAISIINRNGKTFLAIADADQAKEMFFYNDLFFNRVRIDFSKLTKISDSMSLSFSEIQLLHIND